MGLMLLISNIHGIDGKKEILAVDERGLYARFGHRDSISRSLGLTSLKPL